MRHHVQSGKSMLDQLDNHPFDPESAPPGSLAKTRYGNSYLRLTQLVFLRQVLLNKRDKAFYIARALQVHGAGGPTGGPTAQRRGLQAT